jgi:hypothetical protein
MGNKKIKNPEVSDIIIELKNGEAYVTGTLALDTYLLMAYRRENLYLGNKEYPYQMSSIRDAETDNELKIPGGMKLVGLHHVSEDSDDFCENGLEVLKIRCNGYTEKVCAPIAIDCLPMFMFEDKKEGDTVKFRYVNDLTWLEQDPPEEAPKVIHVDLQISLYLNQTGYKYGKFGNFEDAFRRFNRCTLSGNIPEKMTLTEYLKSVPDAHLDDSDYCKFLENHRNDVRRSLLDFCCIWEDPCSEYCTFNGYFVYLLEDIELPTTGMFADSNCYELFMIGADTVVEWLDKTYPIFLLNLADEYWGKGIFHG